jgi:hypothetical protein
MPSSWSWAVGLAVVLACALVRPVSGGAAVDPGDLTLGRSLVAYGACNDCHSPGWRESDGKLPTAGWMVGSSIGFRGPWGTVYPANVRLEFQRIDESQWLTMVRTRGGHPPMVWHDLRALNDQQLRAIYRFVRSLGAAGEPAPVSVPPDLEPKTPYYDVAPQRPRPASR